MTVACNLRLDREPGGHGRRPNTPNWIPRFADRYPWTVDLLVSEVPPAFLLGFAFVFGSAWGSFFNVAIYRWPRDESVVRPPSRCPGCGAPIAARYNVPIFGYLLLRGKTACCGTKLSPRYPIVEALSGVLCVAVAKRFVLDADPDAALASTLLSALAYFVFVGGLVIATFVDLEHQIIPDEVSLPGAAVGLVSAVFRDPERIADFAIGAGAGFLIVQVFFVWAYETFAGRRGMGEGDAKLLLMIGAFLGYQGVLFSIFLGAAQGVIAYVVQRIATAGEPEPDPEPELPEDDQADDGDYEDDPPPEYWGHAKIPFGPFLALGALECLFFGDVAIDAWFALLSGG